MHTPKDVLRVHLWPHASGEDMGEGGVGRVIRGQQDHLPAFGIELVNDPCEADLLAGHITFPQDWDEWPEKPRVAMVHGLYWSEFEWPGWCHKANRQVIEAILTADATTAPSEWVANAVWRHTSRPAVVITHGVDMAEWEPTQNLGYVLWDKTRVDPVCDPAPVNELAERMKDTLFLTTFGDEQPNVKVVGKRTYAEAREMMRAAGCYLATPRETFGVSILQALAAGVPVVGWRWGGAAEIVTHGKDGWLATPGDWDGLRDGVRWAIEHREVIAPAAQAKARTYSWESACEQYAALYRETYARARRASPRTSIVVTAYNLAAYLPAALASVQAQTDGDWECIVVDDASPDESGAIADEYALTDERFHVVHNETNQYLAGARNTGIAAARGRYILPLDADDMLAPDSVQVLGDALDKDRKIAVAYGNVRFVREDGELEQYPGHESGHSGWPMPFRHDWQLSQRNMLPYSSMFRRTAWEWTAGYRTRCRTAEDADFWCRLSSYGFRPAMVTQGDTLIYRNREGSMSRTEGTRDWTAWFPWARDSQRGPAASAAQPSSTLLPDVRSLDPPALSVIIPVGPGHERYVMDAVDSVDAQTLREWECIVVDDTGGTLPTLPPWVRVLSTGKRGSGPARARNIGIAASRATRFLPLDADDVLQPEALDALLRVGRQFPGEVVYSDFWEDPDLAGRYRPYETCDDVAGNLVRHGLCRAVTALTPRAVWTQVGGYDETLPAWEDWAFALSCASEGICERRVAAPLWIYRKHTGFRRNDNQSQFDAGKAAIKAKFGRYWEGEELMACSGCGARRSVGAPASAGDAFGAARRPDGDAQLIAYNGGKTGRFAIRGISGTLYRFAKGETKYVLARDVQWFLSMEGYTLVADVPQIAVGEGPPLVPEGPPR